MKKKVLSILLVGILIVGLTGCGSNESKNKSIDGNSTTSESKTKEDNQKLVDDLNNYISKVREEWDSKQRVGYISISHLQDDFKGTYTFLALCEDEFKEIPDIKEFAYKEDLIPNYDGYCMYDTVELQHERNKERKLHTVVLVNETNEYYDVYITFKTFKMNDKTYTYPIFSNSKLLK